MFVELDDPTVDIMKLAFPDYKGRKFEVVEAVTVSLDGAYWSGGSRNTWKAVMLDGRSGSLTIREASSMIQNPFRVPEAPVLEMVSGVAIVRHCIFQGKDLGLKLYLHPSNMVKMIPEQVDADVKAVLVATRSYKSSYGGDPLYRQRNSGLGLEAWNRAKEEAQRLGYLDARGAITNKGRNVC